MEDRRSIDNHDGGSNENEEQAEYEGRARSVPPTLLRVYADNQDKRSLCIFWTVFFFILVLISILSVTLPEELYLRTNQSQFSDDTFLQNCSNPTVYKTVTVIDKERQQLYCESSMPPQTTNSSDATNDDVQIGIILRHMSKLHQFAIVFMKFYIKDSSKSINIKEQIHLEIDEIIEQNRNDDLTHFYKGKQLHTKHTMTLTLHEEESLKIYGDDHESVIGYRFPILVDRDLNESSSLILVTFTEPQKLANIDLAQAEAEILIVNPEFTKYTFAIRYVFFFLSLIACVLYIYKFCKIPKTERIVQQKMILTLSILLVLFNDPFYPIAILSPNPVSSYFSVFFVVNFIIMLLFLWIIFLDRIFFEDGEKITKVFDWKRYIYIFVTYLLTLILYVQYAIDNIEDLPIIPAQDLLAPQFIVLEVAVLIFVISGFIYISIQYIRSCMSVESKLWRNQMFMFFSTFFLFTTLVLFIVNGFRINSYHGNQILLLYTQMNMYTFYLQYMYRVTPEEYERIEKGQVDFENHHEMLSAPQSQLDFVELDLEKQGPPQLDARAGEHQNQSNCSSENKYELKMNLEQQPKNKDDFDDFDMDG